MDLNKLFQDIPNTNQEESTTLPDNALHARLQQARQPTSTDMLLEGLKRPYTLPKPTNTAKTKADKKLEDLQFGASYNPLMSQVDNKVYGSVPQRYAATLDESVIHAGQGLQKAADDSYSLLTIPERAALGIWETGANILGAINDPQIESHKERELNLRRNSLIDMEEQALLADQMKMKEAMIEFKSFVKQEELDGREGFTEMLNLPQDALNEQAMLWYVHNSPNSSLVQYNQAIEAGDMELQSVFTSGMSEEQRTLPGRDYIGKDYIEGRKQFLDTVDRDLKKVNLDPGKVVAKTAGVVTEQFGKIGAPPRDVQVTSLSKEAQSARMYIHSINIDKNLSEQDLEGIPKAFATGIEVGKAILKEVANHPIQTIDTAFESLVGSLPMIATPSGKIGLMMTIFNGTIMAEGAANEDFELYIASKLAEGKEVTQEEKDYIFSNYRISHLWNNIGDLIGGRVLVKAATMPLQGGKQTAKRVISNTVDTAASIGANVASAQYKAKAESRKATSEEVLTAAYGGFSLGVSGYSRHGAQLTARGVIKATPPAMKHAVIPGSKVIAKGVSEFVSDVYGAATRGRSVTVPLGRDPNAIQHAPHPKATFKTTLPKQRGILGKTIDLTKAVVGGTTGAVKQAVSQRRERPVTIEDLDTQMVHTTTEGKSLYTAAMEGYTPIKAALSLATASVPAIQTFLEVMQTGEGLTAEIVNGALAEAQGILQVEQNLRDDLEKSIKASGWTENSPNAYKATQARDALTEVLSSPDYGTNEVLSLAREVSEYVLSVKAKMNEAQSDHAGEVLGYLNPLQVSPEILDNLIENARGETVALAQEYKQIQENNSQLLGYKNNPHLNKSQSNLRDRLLSGVNGLLSLVSKAEDTMRNKELSPEGKQTSLREAMVGLFNFYNQNRKVLERDMTVPVSRTDKGYANATMFGGLSPSVLAAYNKAKQSYLESLGRGHEYVAVTKDTVVNERAFLESISGQNKETETQVRADRTKKNILESLKRKKEDTSKMTPKEIRQGLRRREREVNTSLESKEYENLSEFNKQEVNKDIEELKSINKQIQDKLEGQSEDSILPEGKLLDEVHQLRAQADIVASNIRNRLENIARMPKTQALRKESFITRATGYVKASISGVRDTYNRFSNIERDLQTLEHISRDITNNILTADITQMISDIKSLREEYDKFQKGDLSLEDVNSFTEGLQLKLNEVEAVTSSMYDRHRMVSRNSKPIEVSPVYTVDGYTFTDQEIFLRMSQGKEINLNNRRDVALGKQIEAMVNTVDSFRDKQRQRLEARLSEVRTKVGELPSGDKKSNLQALQSRLEQEIKEHYETSYEDLVKSNNHREIHLIEDVLNASIEQVNRFVSGRYSEEISTETITEFETTTDTVEQDSMDFSGEVVEQGQTPRGIANSRAIPRSSSERSTKSKIVHKRSLSEEGTTTQRTIEEDRLALEKGDYYLPIDAYNKARNNFDHSRNYSKTQLKDIVDNLSEIREMPTERQAEAKMEFVHSIMNMLERQNRYLTVPGEYNTYNSARELFSEYLNNETTTEHNSAAVNINEAQKKQNHNKAFSIAHLLGKRNQPVLSTNGILKTVFEDGSFLSNENIIRSPMLFTRAGIIAIENSLGKRFDREERKIYEKKLGALHNMMNDLIDHIDYNMLGEFNINNLRDIFLETNPEAVVFTEQTIMKNGVPTLVRDIPYNIKAAMALMGLQWMNSTALMTTRMHDNELYNFLGITEGNPIPQAVRDKYEYAGRNYNEAANFMGRLISQTLNMNFDESKLPAGQKELLNNKLGLLTLRALESAEFVETINYKTSEIAKDLAEHSVPVNNDSIGSDGFGTIKRVRATLNSQYFNENAQVKPEYKDKIHELPEHQIYSPKVRGVRDTYKRAYNLSENILGRPYDLTKYPSATPLGEVIDIPEGTDSKIVKNLRKFANKRRELNEVSKGILTRKDNESIDQWADRAIEELTALVRFPSLDTVHESQRNSVLASQETVRREISDLVDSFVSNPELIENGFYLAPKLQVTGRQYIENTKLNPQMSKLHRYLVTSEGETYTFTRENGNDNIPTIMWALGLDGVHTEAEFNEAARKLEDKVIDFNPKNNGKERARILSNVVNKNFSELTNTEWNEIVELIDIYGINGEHIAAQYLLLKDIINHTLLDDGDIDSYTSSITIEADGINNGLATSMVQLPLLNDTQEMSNTEISTGLPERAKTLLRGLGFSFGEGSVSGYFKRSEAKDGYQHMGERVFDTLGRDVSGGLFGILGFRGEPNRVTGLLRDVFKLPTMVSNYSAGRNTILANGREGLLESFTTRLQEIAKDPNTEDVTTLNEGFKVLNPESTVEFTRENLLLNDDNFLQAKDILVGKESSFAKTFEKGIDSYITEFIDSNKEFKDAINNAYNLQWEAYVRVYDALVGQALQNSKTNVLTEDMHEAIVKRLENSLPGVTIKAGGMEFRVNFSTPINSNQMKFKRRDNARHEPRNLREALGGHKNALKTRGNGLEVNMEQSYRLPSQVGVRPFVLTVHGVEAMAMALAQNNPVFEGMPIFDGVNVHGSKAAQVAVALNEAYATIMKDFDVASAMTESVVEGFSNLRDILVESGLEGLELLPDKEFYYSTEATVGGTINNASTMFNSLRLVLEDIAAAKQAFQESIDESPNGELHVSQYHTLTTENRTAPDTDMSTVAILKQVKQVDPNLITLLNGESARRNENVENVEGQTEKALNKYLQDYRKDTPKETADKAKDFLGHSKTTDSSFLKESAKHRDATPLSGNHAKKLLSTLVKRFSTDSKTGEHYSTLMNNIISPLLDILGDRSIVVLEAKAKEITEADGMYNVGTREVIIQEGYSSEFIAGNPNQLEVYMHELVHAVTIEALSLNPKFAADIATLFHKAAQSLDYNVFLTRNPDGSLSRDTADITKAKETYDYIFNNPLNTQVGGRLVNSGLAEFVSYAATNMQLREALDQISIKTNSTSPGFFTTNDTLFKQIVNNLYKALVDFVDKLSGEDINPSLQEAFDRTISSLLASNEVAKESLWDNMMDVSDHLDATIYNHGKALANELKTAFKAVAEYNRDKERQADIDSRVTILANMLSLTGKNKDHVKATFNRVLDSDNSIKALDTEILKATRLDPNSLANTIKDTVFDVNGSTTEALEKQIGAIPNVSRIVMATVSATQQQLIGFREGITDKQAESVTGVMEVGFGEIVLKRTNEQVTSLLSKKSERNKEVKRLSSVVRATINQNKIPVKRGITGEMIANGMIAQAIGMSHHMIDAGSKGVVANQLNNRYAVALGYAWNKEIQTTIRENLSEEQIQTLAETVGEIASINGLNNINSRELAEFSELWNKDSSKENIREIFHIKQSANETASMFLFTDNDNVQMNDGHVHQRYSNNVDMQIIPSNKANEYRNKGYEIKPINKEIVQAYKKIPPRVRHVEGAMPVASERGSGISIVELHNLRNDLELHSGGEHLIRKMAENKRDLATKQQLLGQRVRLDDNSTPVLDDFGNVLDYRYNVSRDTKQNILGQKRDYIELLPHDVANTTRKKLSREFAMETFEALKEDYELNKGTEEYVWINGNEYDALGNVNPHYHRYRNLPKEIRQEIRKNYGSRGIPVREGMAHIIFGVTQMSVSDTNIVESLDNRFPGFKNNVRAAEAFWQELVNVAKKRAGVLKPKIFAMNFISNNVVLLNNGISMVQAAKDQKEAIGALTEYHNLQRRKIQLANRINRMTSPDAIMKHSAELARINAIIEASMVKEIIDEGMLHSLNDDLINFGDDSYIGKLNAALTKRGESLIGESSYGKMTKIPKELFMTENSNTGQFMSKATQYMDFIARYSLHRHLNQRNTALPLDQRMTKREINKIVRDSFINYSKPDHQYLQYGNDMGIVWFTKYYLGIQHVVARQWKRNPSKSLGIVLAQILAGNISDIYDDSIYNRSPASVFNNPIQKTMGELVTPHALDPVRWLFDI